MGEEWNNMTDKDKKTFHDLAQNDKARYEKDKAEYESKGADKKSTKKKEETSGKTSEKKGKKVQFYFFILFLTIFSLG